MKKLGVLARIFFGIEILSEIYRMQGTKMPKNIKRKKIKSLIKAFNNL